MAGLPQSVLDLVKASPVEDIMLYVLREGIPEISVQSQIEANQHFPFVLVRRLPQLGSWDGDPRFTDSADVAIHAFCMDPDGDADAALLSEAVKSVLFDAMRDQLTIPGMGQIKRVVMRSAPRRAPDWATSVGPVQYADLPTGVVRYEAHYQMLIRILK